MPHRESFRVRSYEIDPHGFAHVLRHADGGRELVRAVSFWV